MYSLHTLTHTYLLHLESEGLNLWKAFKTKSYSIQYSQIVNYVMQKVFEMEQAQTHIS